jgi:hypothetical protein
MPGRFVLYRNGNVTPVIGGHREIRGIFGVGEN